MRMMKPILWVITRLFGTAIVCPACCLMFICCVRVFWCHLLLWYCVYYAAAILQILLLRGGVEPNPGPIMRVPTRDIEMEEEEIDNGAGTWVASAPRDLVTYGPTEDPRMRSSGTMMGPPRPSNLQLMNPHQACPKLTGNVAVLSGP
eukprot:jgi/Botrbrau1/11114/Bobra.0219s0022.1